MTLEPTPAGTPHSYATPAETSVCLDPHDPRYQRTTTPPLNVVGELGAGRMIVVDEAWQLIAPDADALRALLGRARPGAAGTLSDEECSS